MLIDASGTPKLGIGTKRPIELAPTALAAGSWGAHTPSQTSHLRRANADIHLSSIFSKEIAQNWEKPNIHDIRSVKMYKQSCPTRKLKVSILVGVVISSAYRKGPG